MLLLPWTQRICHQSRSSEITTELAHKAIVPRSRWLTPGKSGAFDRSMQHHLKDLWFKDGVYEPTEAVETFSHAESGYLAVLEGGAVFA